MNSFCVFHGNKLRYIIRNFVDYSHLINYYERLKSGEGFLKMNHYFLIFLFLKSEMQFPFDVAIK